MKIHNIVVKDSPLCSFFNEKQDSVGYMMFTYAAIEEFWNTSHISVEHILLWVWENNTLNFILIIITKLIYTIHRHLVKDHIYNRLNEMNHIYYTERYNAKFKCKQTIFDKYWAPRLPTLKESGIAYYQLCSEYISQSCDSCLPKNISFDPTISFCS